MNTIESLIAFETRIKDAFLAKQIHAPIHLSGGNEEQLIKIFKNIRPGDWVFSTWRSHYHALLKGIPEQWVMDEILAGRSMYLMNKEHRFFCSAIVGGILPIACGVALGIRQSGVVSWHPDREKVWVFVGDMAARSGQMHEFLSYTWGHGLPVHVVIEDNGLSTNTPTKEAWGTETRPQPVDRYTYERVYPHVGCGTYVQF